MGAMLSFDGLSIDLQARQVTVSGIPVELTVKEFDLLAFLGARPGRVFTRDELLRAVWQSASEFQQASTVTEHMRRLRAKVESEPAAPAILVAPCPTMTPRRSVDRLERLRGRAIGPHLLRPGGWTSAGERDRVRHAPNHLLVDREGG
jgi:hypothetical protein